MTKEEMLALVELLEGRLDKKLGENLRPIHDRLDKVDARLEKMDTRLDEMENRQVRLEIKIENETDRAIRILAEGQQVNSSRLDGVAVLNDRMDDLENRVSAVEFTLKNQGLQAQ